MISYTYIKSNHFFKKGGYFFGKDYDIYMDRNRYVDVICQFKKDGEIIPIKVRFEYEDGALQEYKIKSYRQVTETNQYVMVTSSMIPFECKVEAFGEVRTIFLTFNCNNHVWLMKVKR